MHCIRSLFFNFKNISLSNAAFVPINRPLKIQKFFPAQRLFCVINNVEEDTDKIINAICKGQPELEKKLRIFMLEVEVMRQDGRQAPNSLRQSHWEHLMTLPSKNQRSNYLMYLWKTEKSKENKKAKQESKRKEFETTEKKDISEFSDDLLYGIKEQSLFLRIRDKSINNYDNYRALQAMMRGQPLVIDCSYEEHMVWREALNAAKQMTFVFGDNRIHKDPFNIYLCNTNPGGPFMKQLYKNIPSLEEPWFPMNIHTESYLNLFPKEKLVYLTPHCRDELTQFDPDAIYIIGCMVDKVNNEPLSLAKAKRDGIKMVKLPLDRYLEWAPGSKKNLNINHMVPIMLDLKLTGDWEYALRHIPRRKLMETKILAMQNKIKDKPLLRGEILKNFFKKNPSIYKRQQTTKKSLYFDDDSV